MASFSTQTLERQATANVRTGTFRGGADANLAAGAWSDITKDVFKDLNYLKDRFELMSGELPEFLALGRVTTRHLEDNTKLLERLINFKDTTQGVLGAAIQGLKIVRVVGNTYKDVPGINTDLEGYPGKGDYLRQTWDRLNKVDMMTKEYGSGRWEWGLMANRQLGYTACGWTHKLHKKARKSPTEFYMHQVIEHDPLEIKNIAEISVTPVVTDFANALRIDQTAMQ